MLCRAGLCIAGYFPVTSACTHWITVAPLCVAVTLPVVPWRPKPPSIQNPCFNNFDFCFHSEIFSQDPGYSFCLRQSLASISYCITTIENWSDRMSCFMLVFLALRMPPYSGHPSSDKKPCGLANHVVTMLSICDCKEDDVKIP